MENKKNDWFASLLYQPDYSLEQFKDIGVTPENTGFRSRDEYKNMKAVQEAFTKDDKFDEKAFNSFYDSALLLYNDYANKMTEGRIASSFEYDPWEWRKGASAPTKDTGAILGINPNPMRETTGIRQLGISTPSQFSIREIAQGQKYYDVETGQWSDMTPNDFAGVFKSFTAPTLVLATYDEDTEEIVDGKKIIHPKGSYKTNAYGAPYYETLGNREIYDKDALHASDIFSVDGSKWNKWDFFDSDGLETDPLKVAAKNIVRIAPFLILGPAGTVFAGLSAATALLEFMPTFLKAVDGILTDDVMGNEFGKKMNQYEAWLSRLDYSVSDRSREKLVTFENIGKMFGDVSAQLFQQRAVAKLPTLFKNPKIANNQKLGRALSYSYMSATSSREAYSTFKQAGANDTTAGLATLALMGVYYKLMSSDYFKDILFKGTWLDETQYKEKAWAVMQDFQQAIAKGTVPAVDNPTHAAGTIKWFQNAFEKLIKGMPVTGKNFMQASLSEGVEEVMEEVGIDMLKGVASGLNALGIPVAEDKLDFGFGLEDVTRRYLTSFIGGAFGGAVFHGYNLMNPEYRASKATAETPEARMSELIYLIASGKSKDIYRYAAKLRNQGLLGSNDLAGTKFETVEGINGLEPALVSSEKEMSQNDFVYNEFVKQINYIETLLSDEGFIKRRSEVAKLLNLDEDSAIVATIGNGAGPFAMNASNLILKDLNRLGTQIVQTRAKIDELVASLKPQGDTAYDKAEFEKALKDNEQYKSLLEDLKKLREQRDEIYEKKNISKYMTQASVILSNDIMQALRGFSTIEDYTMFKYRKPYSEFTPAQQENIKLEYDSYTNGESDQPFEIGEIYRVFSEQLTHLLTEKERLYSKLTPDVSVASRTLGNDYIENIKAKINLQKQHDALVVKENKTQEDLDNIAKLNDAILKLDAGIETLRNNPAFSVSLFSESPIDYDTFEQGADIILDHYRSFAGKLKTDDTELYDFYTQLRQEFQKHNVNGLLETWIAEQPVFIEPGELDEEHADIDFFDSVRDHPTRDEAVRLIKDLYANIGINNRAVLEDYNTLVTLLKEKVGLNDDEINSLLFNDIDNGIVTVSNPDGTTQEVRSYQSILPRLGTKTLLEFMSEIDGLRSQITYSDVTDLIKKFAFNIGDPDLISILDLIGNEEKNIINSTKLDSYTVSNNAILEQLKKAKFFLEAIDSTIAGSYNGLNHIINQYRQKEKKTPFAELSDNTAKTLHKNLEILKNRVNFILELHAVNSGQKLRIQGEIGVTMRVKFLQELAADVYIEDFSNEFNKGEALNLQDIIKENVSDDFDFGKITTDNFAKYEADIVKAETAIFNTIKETGYSDEEIVDKLVAVYGPKSLWKQRSSKLTSEKNLPLTDYDLVLYAATIMSLNSNDFFVKYRDAVKEFLETEESEDKKLVPVYGQEYALRLAYAFVHNKGLFNSLMDAIADTYEGDEKYIKAKKDRILHNVVSIFGGAGTGKTRGVAFLLSKLFDNSEFRFVAPTEKQTSTLLDVFGRTGKTEEAYTFDQWFAKFAPGIDSIENIEVDNDGTITTKENKVNPIEWFSTDNTKTRVMVVDEAGLLNSVQLKALSDYAEKLGIFVVTLGDFKQNSGTITYKTKSGVETDADGFEETIGVRTPTLTATFRAANIAKAHNYERLDSALAYVDDKIKESDTGVETNTADKFLKDVPGVQLDYYIDDTEISGDYITKDEASFKNLLDRVLDHGYDILVITDDETIKKYSDPKYDGKVTFRSAKEAQGGEFDYVFVDKSIPSSTYLALKDLYTTSQRATLGSVILDTQSFYLTNSIASSILNRSATLPYDMSPEQKGEFAKWRLAALEGLNPTENFDTNIEFPINGKVKEVKTVQKVQQQTPHKPEVEADPEKNPEAPKNPEEEEKKVSENNGEEVSNPEEKPIEEKPQELEHKKPIPLEDNTEVKEFKLNPFVYEDDSVPERYDESEPKIQSERGFSRIDNFYNFISTDEFYNSEMANQQSILSYLGDNGIKLAKDQYVELMLFANKILLNNENFQQKALGISISGLNVRMTAKLRTLLGNPKNNHVICSINQGEQSLLALRISNEVGETLGYVPFGVTHGLPTGRFTADHKFKIFSKPHFKKGTFVTIASLKKKYPWLNIAKRGGIIINSDDIQNGNFNEWTKKYAKRNNGKAMAFGYDIANVDVNNLLKLSENADGTNYLHSQREEVDAFGVQKKINPKELIGYSVSLYWLNGMGKTDGKQNLINALKNSGIINDSATTDRDVTEQVCRYLANLTGNEDWKNTIILNRKFGKEYFDEVKKLNDASELISYIQTNRILTDLFGAALRGEYDLFRNQLYKEFSRIEYTKSNGENAGKRVRRNKAIHFDFNGDQYILRVSEYNAEGQPTKIGLFNYDENSSDSYGDALFSARLSVGTFNTELKNIVTKLMGLYNATLEDFNSSNLRISLKDDPWLNETFQGFQSINAISSLYSMFEEKFEPAFDKILNSKQFKYAIYGNIKKGPVLEGTQMAQFDVNDDYITDASEWFGGVYYYNEDLFVPGENDLENDNKSILLDSLRERIDSMKDNLKSMLPEEEWDILKERLLTNFKSLENPDDYQLDELFNSFLSDVNERLLEHATSRTTPQYSYVDGEIVEGEVFSKEQAYSNLISKFDGPIESKNEIAKRFGNIEVIQNGDRFFVTFTDPDNKLLIRETKTLPQWLSIKDEIDNVESTTNTKVNQKIKTYLFSLLTDTITDDIVGDYESVIKKASSVYEDSIKRGINAYLEERLKNEEC